MDQFLEFFNQHPFLFLALGAVLALLVANEVHGNLTGGKRLSALEAVRLINDRSPVIVDVRSPVDYKRGHLLGAVNAPLAKLDEHLPRLGKDRQQPVLVYCALGSSSLTATEKIRAAGFSEVYPLRGGLNAWAAANLPVTTR
jgi:rhodanese-related sulfurtransferase